MGDVFHADCPAREVLDHLASRWAVLVLFALLEQPRRYHQLRTTVDGISDKMLSATLRTLRNDGLVRRDVGAGQPPEVTYSVTELGHGAATAFRPLLDWIGDNAQAIRDSVDREVIK